MKDIQKSTITEIIELHKDLEGLYRQGLPMAIRIGELLTKTKNELPHGEFHNWVKSNLPFTTQTAFNYRKLYKIRNKLKSKRVLLLNEAYKEAGVLKSKPAPVINSRITKDEDGDTFLDIKYIDPNPFFDISRLVTQHVKWRIGAISIPYFGFVHGHLAVREYKDRYQNVCDHHIYYAHHHLRSERVWIKVIDIDDKNMKKVLDDFDYPRYEKYIEGEKARIEYELVSSHF